MTGFSRHQSLSSHWLQQAPYRKLPIRSSQNKGVCYKITLFTQLSSSVPHQVSDKFAFGLFDLDWDVFMQHIEGAINRVPALEKTGIKSTVCGPGTTSVAFATYNQSSFAP